MKLLLSNDDGIFAPGIKALANGLADAGHETIVVCPDRERSATGHGLTLHKPIRADQIDSIFQPGVRAWACSGTPSDCVKLAIGALLDSKPDMVLSGINQGSNLGTDVLYSGTVSAAMEGTIEEIPSIALSLASFSSQDFQPAVNFARTLLEQLSSQPLPKPMLLNVNIPAIAPEKIAGVTLARQGVRRYCDLFEKRIDPRGKTYYWLAGELLQTVEEVEIGSQLQAWPTDVQAIQDNYITVTPLQYNLTDARSWQHWQTSALSLFKDRNP